MIIEVGLTTKMEVTPSVFHAKNWLYLKSKQGNRICIDLNTGDIVKGQCHKMPGLSKEQITKIIEDWKVTNNER